MIAKFYGGSQDGAERELPGDGSPNPDIPMAPAVIYLMAGKFLRPERYVQVCTDENLCLRSELSDSPKTVKWVSNL